jgi:hypothetical protein
MTTAKPCANAACTCLSSEKGKYCSRHCEGVESAIPNTVELICKCGHPGCGRAALNI